MYFHSFIANWNYRNCAECGFGKSRKLSSSVDFTFTPNVGYARCLPRDAAYLVLWCLPVHRQSPACSLPHSRHSWNWWWSMAAISYHRGDCGWVVSKLSQQCRRNVLNLWSHDTNQEKFKLVKVLERLYKDPNCLIVRTTRSFKGWVHEEWLSFLAKLFCIK